MKSSRVAKRQERRKEMMMQKDANRSGKVPVRKDKVVERFKAKQERKERIKAMKKGD